MGEQSEAEREELKQMLARDLADIQAKIAENDKWIAWHSKWMRYTNPALVLLNLFFVGLAVSNMFEGQWWAVFPFALNGFAASLLGVQTFRHWTNNK